MGYNIYIGKVSLREPDEETCCFNYTLNIEMCKGSEPKGLTSKEHTIWSGEPQRAPSYSGWHQFMNSSENLKKLSEFINPKSSDGWCYNLNNFEIISLLNKIENELESYEPCNKDRAKWLCYWSKEAVKQFGKYAAIGFY